jgi:hypothetical protein
MGRPGLTLRRKVTTVYKSVFTGHGTPIETRTHITHGMSLRELFAKQSRPAREIASAEVRCLAMTSRKVS